MNTKTRPVGRPRSTAASSHADIISAVYDLLQTTSVRDLTIENIAKHARVGKPTIYKWWGSKADLVLCMVQERVVPELDPQDKMPLADSIRLKAHRLIDAFNGFFGRVIAELIAEGQNDPALLQRLNEQYVLPRRASTVSDIRRAQAEGDFPPEIDPEIVVDAVFGSIYFHMITKVHPLTHAYADLLVDNVFALTKQQN